MQSCSLIIKDKLRKKCCSTLCLPKPLLFSCLVDICSAVTLYILFKTIELALLLARQISHCEYAVFFTLRSYNVQGGREIHGTGFICNKITHALHRHQKCQCIRKSVLLETRLVLQTGLVAGRTASSLRVLSPKKDTLLHLSHRKPYKTLLA